MHIGPSPLGKALLLPLSQNAGFEICVVGRPGGEPLPLDAAGNATYRLKWEGSHPREEIRYVDWYREAGSVGGLPQEVLDAIGQGDVPIMITATLRGAIAERRSLIEEIIRARPAGAETVVMPCENTILPDWSAIQELCAELGASYLRPLVNRIALPLNARGPNSRTTRTHDLGEWLVEAPAGSSEILAALEINAEFRVVDELDLRWLRKLYMVNGAHLALGIRGALLDRRSLRVTAREGIYDVANLHFAMSQGMSFAGSNLSDTFEYGRAHIRAYCEVDDRISRILKKLRRSDIRPFLREVDERLSAPAELTADAQRALDPAHESGEWLASYRDVFDRLELLLGRLDSYQDGKPSKRKGLRLDAEIDADAVALYEETLRRWEPAGARMERARRLQESLRAHRVLLRSAG